MKALIRASIISVFTLPSINLPGQNPRSIKSFDLGEEKFNERKFHEALEFYNECLRLEPGYGPAYFSRAETKEQLNDLGGAHTDYNILLALVPKHKEGTLNRGIVRYELELYSLAIEDFLLFLKLPGGGGTHSIYYRSSNNSGTDRIFTAQSNIRDQIFNYLGLTETKLLHWAGAITYFDSAIRLQPGDPDYFVHRGFAFQNSGDHESARKDYLKALSLEPGHSIASANLGALSMKEGNPDDAEAKLSESIESNPRIAGIWAERGYLRMQRGYLKGALEDYTAAILLDSTNSEFLVDRGIVQEKMDDLPAALNDFTKATSLNESYEKGWFHQGNIFLKLDKYQEAMESYSVAIRYFPEYANAFYNRAITNQRLGKLKEGCDDLKMAERLGLTVDTKLKSKICKEQ